MVYECQDNKIYTGFKHLPVTALIVNAYMYLLTLRVNVGGSILYDTAIQWLHHHINHGYLGYN